MENGKKFCTVKGYQMAYVENSSGQKASKQTLLFLHGNPTSSYLWRNVMKPLQKPGRRLIAPDLIGMGDSDKLDAIDSNSYRFVQHADFLDGLLDCVLHEDEKVVLVLHDWGSALGFWWARRYPKRIQGIAFMEAIVRPFSYSTMENVTVELFQLLRTPDIGEDLVLNQNFFVEVVVPDAIIRNLTNEEMNAYRAPYLEPGNDRLPTLVWPREVPIDGIPEDVTEIVANYSEWMGTDEANFPKLFINADPGVLLVDVEREMIRTKWTTAPLVEVTVPGIHYIQEDSPDEIAQAIEAWLAVGPLVGESHSDGMDTHSGWLLPVIFAVLGLAYFVRK